MNKITIEPFGNNCNPHIRDAVTPTRLMNRIKKNIVYGDKYKVNQTNSKDQEETIHFDDSFCFKDGKRPVTTNQKSRDMMSQKKCFSQIMNVKVDPKDRDHPRKGSFFQLSGPKNLIKGSNFPIFFDYLEQTNTEQEQEQRNYTSYSTRKKYHTIKAQTHENLLSERKVNSRPQKLNKSTLIPSSPKAAQISTPQKRKFKSRTYCEAGNFDPFKCEKSKEKKYVPFSQSRIKAQQIRAVPLLEREEERQMTEKRRKDQKTLYLQMLSQLKKKEALNKKNAKMKEEIQNCTLKAGKKIITKAHGFSMAQIRMRKYQSTKEDKEQVKPWDVQPLSAQPHFTDQI